MSDNSKTPQLILASGSPRRQAFFRDLCLEFEVQVGNIDETPVKGEEPIALAKRLARAKSAAIGHENDRPTQKLLVVAADTVVALEGEILGKPSNAEDAVQMLLRLRNRTHAVITGVSVYDCSDGTQETVANCTDVLMRNYTDDEIIRYVASGDPLDKAGAYAIQHPEFAPVVALNGCLSGVMGLPLNDLRNLLARFGVVVQYDIAPICEMHSAFRCCQRCVD